MREDYSEFIRSKQRKANAYGFEPKQLNKHLFDWQRCVTEWAVKRGRAALFEEPGLGKTIQQLAWAEEVVEHTNKPVMLHCPVGVRHQTQREAEKFGVRVPVYIANHAGDVSGAGIYVVNYEKLHHFDTSVFSGVVIDEAGILKNYTGKRKRAIVSAYRRTPHRLACTATPAPNDVMEIGNQSEFLGVMPSNEMLSRWFINDTMKAGGYRLKKHAEKDFWRWVASWAVCISKPSDIEGSDEGFDLPELIVNRHIVTPEQEWAPPGYLWNASGVSATNIHQEKRMTLDCRVDKTAEIESQIDDFCIIWCDTNYESDELCKAMPHAIEIRGSDSEDDKESKLGEFIDGHSRTLITKPTIAGMGLNLQFCNRQIFAGLSFSFEMYYQAVRRCWRFGQDRPVTVDIVLAESESAIESAVARKESDHRLMQAEMAIAMREATLAELQIERPREIYQAVEPIELPAFLKKKEQMS